MNNIATFVGVQDPASREDVVVSPLLSAIRGVEHGFGTMSDPVPRFAVERWRERPTKRQVHGVRIATASYGRQDAGEADGWFTRTPGLLLTVVNADCLPVLMARRDGEAVAALHIGWRGALQGMVGQISSLLCSAGEDARDWVAAIGPGAGACCYEVSSELVDEFVQTQRLPRIAIEPRHRRVNLARIVARQFGDFGFADVSITGECTICCRRGKDQAPRFFSYRRDRTSDVQVSAIMRTPDQAPSRAAST